MQVKIANDKATPVRLEYVQRISGDDFNIGKQSPIV